MITKNQAMQIIRNYMSESTDDKKVEKCNLWLLKLSTISEKEFNEIARHTLGEDSGVNEFNSWLMQRLQGHELQGTKFVELNEFVSYNIAGSSQKTLALHIVPKHVTNKDIRNSGSYLAEALEHLRAKIKNGEFENIESVFAVSDILKLKILQGYFKELGFDIKEGEEIFKGHFRNPYQAHLSKEVLVSDEWEELKEQFMKSRPTVEELHDKNKEDIDETIDK